MKLYLLEVDNGLDYADYDENFKLVVEQNKAAAAIRAIEYMHECYEKEWYPYASFQVTEIKEVDGHEIKVCKKDD